MTRITEGEHAMSWNDFYQRRDVMAAVLRQARRDPGGALPFSGIPGAVEAFGTEENLLLALHYKWTQLLTGYLRTEIGGPEDVADVPSGRDQVDAVSRAWQRATREHRELRAVLDAHVDRYSSLRKAQDTEHRVLAVTAGLAEPYESAQEAARIGAAFVSLVENSPVRTGPRRRNPVGQLLKMLAPSA
ncbi:hypothetical protein [Amycolatopsis cihanbeyliensis]